MQWVTGNFNLKRKVVDMEKIKIERTAFRKHIIRYTEEKCVQKNFELYTDIYAERLCNRIDFDFGWKKQSFVWIGSLRLQWWQLDMIWR